MRGVAAVLVVISHIVRQTRQDWHGSGEIDSRSVLLGGLGVYIFFVISGFIIQYTSQDMFGQKGASSEFLRQRITRIVPLYWLLTSLAILFPAVLYLGHRITIAGAVASFAFLPD